MTPEQKEALRKKRAKEAKEAEMMGGDPGSSNLCDSCA